LADEISRDENPDPAAVVSVIPTRPPCNDGTAEADYTARQAETRAAAAAPDALPRMEPLRFG